MIKDKLYPVKSIQDFCQTACSSGMGFIVPAFFEAMGRTESEEF
jgi:hypothetical protein